MLRSGDDRWGCLSDIAPCGQADGNGLFFRAARLSSSTTPTWQSDNELEHSRPFHAHRDNARNARCSCHFRSLSKRSHGSSLCRTGRPRESRPRCFFFYRIERRLPRHWPPFLQPSRAAAEFLAPIVGLTHTADFYGIALRSSSRSCGTGARSQLRRVIQTTTRPANRRVGRPNKSVRSVRKPRIFVPRLGVTIISGLGPGPRRQR